MSEEKKNNTANTDEKEDMKIEWFGIDGLLCLSFVLESCFIGYGMTHDVDIILGRIVPYSAMAITLAIFLKYISQVFIFSRKVKK